jgi:hypothetical protein
MAKKMLTVMVLGAFLILGLSSLGLAQEMRVMKDSAKMMSDGWKMFNDGQRTVHPGRGNEQPGGRPERV